MDPIEREKYIHERNMLKELLRDENVQYFPLIIKAKDSANPKTPYDIISVN